MPASESGKSTSSTMSHNVRPFRPVQSGHTESNATRTIASTHATPMPAASI
jgi:hypothetical protein